MAGCDEKVANREVSRAIPIFLLGAVIYASYAVTKPLCIDYLLHPSSSDKQKPRVGAAIAIIVVFYVLLLPVVATYLKLYFRVVFNPDYLPRGIQWDPEQSQATEVQAGTNPKKKRTRRKRRSRRDRKYDTPAYDLEGGRDQIAGRAFPIGVSGLESFYMKDVFVCQEDGRPPFCSKCCQFKTDRSHHCREVDRCVRKMDHFCPWVGGVVSESSFKFFVQFNFYTVLFCVFCLTIFAIFTAEHRQRTGDVIAQWLVALGLASFFLLFTAGMTMTSVHLAMINSSTVDNINRKTKVWTLAIHVHDPAHLNTSSNRHQTRTFQTITYPSQPTSDAAPIYDEVTRPEDVRVFAILQTQPGENPFDLGSPFKNLQEVLGYTIADWLLPLKPSPCVDHSNPESAYPLGPVVERLKREAGLA